MTNYRLNCDRPVGKSDLENTPVLLQSKLLIHSSGFHYCESNMNSSSRKRLRKAAVVMNKGQLPNLSVFFFLFYHSFYSFFLFLSLKNLKFTASSVCVLSANSVESCKKVLIMTEKELKRPLILRAMLTENQRNNR